MEGGQSWRQWGWEGGLIEPEECVSAPLICVIPHSAQLRDVLLLRDFACLSVSRRLASY